MEYDGHTHISTHTHAYYVHTLTCNTFVGDIKVLYAAARSPTEHKITDMKQITGLSEATFISQNLDGRFPVTW